VQTGLDDALLMSRDDAMAQHASALRCSFVLAIQFGAYVTRLCLA